MGGAIFVCMMAGTAAAGVRSAPAPAPNDALPPGAEPVLQRPAQAPEVAPRAPVPPPHAQPGPSDGAAPKPVPAAASSTALEATAAPQIAEPPVAFNASVDVYAYNEEALIPRPGLRVSLWCTDCGYAPMFSRTEAGGVAHFSPISPGQYKVVVYAPAGPVEGLLQVADGAKAALRVGVPRDPYRPQDDAGRPRYEGFRGPALKRQAELGLAVGGVLLSASAGLAVGAIVESAHPGCRYDTCDGEPRPRLIRSLAIGAGMTAAGSALALSFGAIKLRRYRFGGAAGPEGATLRVSGRF